MCENPTAMTAAQVATVVDSELEACEALDNWHGITLENVHEHSLWHAPASRQRERGGLSNGVGLTQVRPAVRTSFNTQLAGKNLHHGCCCSDEANYVEGKHP